MKNLILPFLLILTLVLSCRSESDEVLEKKVNSYDVYVAGIENNEACYWKNTVKTILTGGTDIKPLKIIIENNDVYVLGRKDNSISDIEYYFWKNNVKYNLKNYLGIPSASKAIFGDFTIKNNTELFAGYVDNISSGTPSYSMCYWKNGLKTSLQNNINNPSQLSIDFYNNTVYFSKSGNINSGYYKNNVFYGVNGEWMQNFAQNNNGVHYLFIDNNNTSLKCYNTDSNGMTFVNTTNLYPNLSEAKLISDPVTHDLYTFAPSIFNTYYKNNNDINFSDPEYRQIQDMKVLNSNLYMIRSFVNVVQPQATYQYKVFINNVQTQYINGSNGSFNSIFVVQN